MKPQIPLLCLALGACASAPAGPITEFTSPADLPKHCALVGAVEDSQSYEKTSPEYSMPTDEVLSRVVELCKTKASELGANVFLNTGYVSFHGAGFFGYECRGEAYKC